MKGLLVFAAVALAMGLCALVPDDLRDPIAAQDHVDDFDDVREDKEKMTAILKDDLQKLAKLMGKPDPTEGEVFQNLINSIDTEDEFELINDLHAAFNEHGVMDLDGSSQRTMQSISGKFLSRKKRGIGAWFRWLISLLVALFD